MTEKKKSVGSGWKKQTSKGEVINLIINGVRYNVWPNSYKKEDREPDYKVYEDNYVKNTETKKYDTPF